MEEAGEGAQKPQVSLTSVGRGVTSCFSPSGLPEQIPSHQALLGGGPARPPGLAVDRRGPAIAPAVSDHWAWVGGLSVSGMTRMTSQQMPKRGWGLPLC